MQPLGRLSLPLPLFYFGTTLPGVCKLLIAEPTAKSAKNLRTRGPIPSRFAVRRPNTSLPELSRDDSGTTWVRDRIQGLLSSLWDMWLMDLREPIGRESGVPTQAFANASRQNEPNRNPDIPGKSGHKMPTRPVADRKLGGRGSRRATLR